MSEAERARAALNAWTANDAQSLASYLAGDFVCRNMFSEPIDKVQYIGIMQAMMTAIPDWSFNENTLHEQPVADQVTSVLFVTHITGTHLGNLVLPDLPIVTPSGTGIRLPERHIEYLVRDNIITAINSDFSPNEVGEVLAQLGMELPS
jgi:hypothetical protein